MPKIITIPSNKVLIEGKEQNFVEESDPKTWSLNYPVGLKKINNLHFAVDHEGTFAKYGLFKSSKLLSEEFVSGMEVTLLNGKEIGIESIKEVPMVEMISTTKEERNKGYAKLLYEAVISRHKILISDKELYTDEGKINRTLGIWSNHFPTLGKVFNINIKTKEIMPFDTTDSNEDVRFLFVKDSSLLSEGALDNIKNFAKKTALAGTAALALHGSSGIAAQEKPDSFKVKHGTELAKPVNKDDIKPAGNTDKTTESLINDKSLYLMIANNEGKKYNTYKDTKGISTIGIGFNIDANKNKLSPELLKAVMSGTINEKTVQDLYKISATQAIKDAKTVFPTFDKLPIQVQKVIIDLCFNMGIGGVKKFQSMISHINAGNYSAAADDLLWKDASTKTQLSQWFHDVTNGAKSFEDIKTKNPNNRAVVDINLLKSAQK